MLWGLQCQSAAFLVLFLFHGVILLPVAGAWMFSQPTEASLRWSSSEFAGSESGKGDTHRAGADAPNWDRAFELWSPSRSALLLQASTSDPSNRLLPGPVTPFPSTPTEVSLTDPFPYHALLGPWKDHPILCPPSCWIFLYCFIDMACLYFFLLTSSEVYISTLWVRLMNVPRPAHSSDRVTEA